MTYKSAWDLASKNIFPLITGFNLNAAAGESTFTGLPAKYLVIGLRPFDASGVPVLATAGLFTLTGGGGTAVVALATLTGLTAASKVSAMTIAVPADYQNAATLFLRCGTAQGSALTASFQLEILDLT